MIDLDMQAALENFHTEAHELLSEMDERLLQVEQAADDPEQLNALFRTVHTIKGTAGLFGLSAVVAFTHRVESVLDRLRRGEVPISQALSSLLFLCKDHIQQLVEQGVAGMTLTAGMLSNDKALSSQLAQYDEPAQTQGMQARAAREAVHDATQAPNQSSDSDGDHAEGHSPQPGARWRISARFGESTYCDGFDPLSVLDYLQDLGTTLSISTRLAGEDDFEQSDPEQCHLAFEIDLASDAPLSTLETAFQFVQDSCDWRIDPLPANQEDSPADDLLAAVAAPPDAEIVAQARAPRPEESRMVRVPAEKLDQLINLVGELVTAGSGNGALARKHRIKEMIASTASLNALIENIRDRALSLRMIAIGETFTRFRRIVRDLSTKLDKQVELELVGVEAELDKSLVERLNDPLVHIVRNALDHGIESPQARLAAGKPPCARLTLSARHEAGGVLISVSDDGAGLDTERILAKARERGLVAADAQLSEDQVNDLIFAPGFSTAASVTDLSGRGVGMDVVRQTIEELRGTVRIRSVRHRGTSVELRLPLTLAIIEGFHVKVGEHQFVLPMDQVVECINSRHLEAPAPGRCTGHLSLRGSALPVLHLRELFELEQTEVERASIVVVRSGSQQIGLVLDSLLGEGQAVIKPMDELFMNLEGIAGSTVLGNGELALILDVPALVALATRDESRAGGFVEDRSPAARLALH